MHLSGLRSNGVRRKLNSRSWIAFGLAAFFFVAAFLVLYQQSITYGEWFEIRQVLHHETVFLVFVALGIGVLVGFIIGRENLFIDRRLTPA